MAVPTPQGIVKIGFAAVVLPVLDDAGGRCVHGLAMKWWKCSTRAGFMCLSGLVRPFPLQWPTHGRAIPSRVRW